MSFRLKPEEKAEKTSRYSAIFGDKLDSLSQDSESTAAVRERLQSLLPQGENYFQRCVIVQKDEFGYGLTVSGENPVYVDSIKPGGAAQQAGVREGDMIVKVNGNLVAKSNHKDVVKLIKSGTYVSLTLLSKQARSTENNSTSSTTSTSSVSTPISVSTNSSTGSVTERPPFISSPSMDWITGPQPVNTETNQELNRQKLNTIRHMYQQAKLDLKRIHSEYDTNPTDKLYSQLQDQLKTVKKIDGQLKALDPQKASGHKRSQSDLTGILKGEMDSSELERNDSMTSCDSASSLSSPQPMDEPDNAVVYSPTLPVHSPLQPKTPSLGSYDSINVRLGSSPPRSLGIITMEDDDFESDDEHQFENHGHFRRLATLMKHPAHLSVFLSYLINNQNPSSMFFYLVTDSYRHGNMKEMRKWAYEIHSTFLNERAPLRFVIDEDLVAGVENVLNAKYDREDSLKTVFDEIRNQVHSQISDLLQEYCNTRALGLGSMFGDHELAEMDSMDRAGQLRVIDKILSPLLEQFLEKEETNDRNMALALCICSFMKNLGVPRTQQNQRLMDRTSSFNEKDKRMFRFPKGSRKVNVVHSHSLEAQHYFTSTYCNSCGGILWGVGNQGYQCQNCDQNFHKSCLDNLKENCSGQSQSKPKKDKSKRTSVLEKIITRKPSNNSPSAIKEAQMIHDAALTSPSGTPTFHVQETVPEDSETSEGPSRVGKLVDRYQKLTKDEKAAKEEESPPSSDKEKTRGSPVGRSESMKGRQKEKNGSGSVRRTKSDVTNDEGSVIKAINDQAVASSSSSSLSTKSTSPSVSLEQVNRVSHESDSDFEVEGDLPPLESVLTKEVLKKLKPKEKKRQEVINELVYTERSHLRNLKVLEHVFYQPWANDQSLPRKLVLQLLPNIGDLVKGHSVIVRAMKIAKPKDGKAFSDIADIMLDYFSGEKGNQFKEASASFCRNHRHALDQLKVKVKKDQKLAQFLQEAEANPLCRRLKLADLIPMQMQRLTKYRLLVEALIKYTTSNSGEHKRLLKVLAEFKDILAFVNQAVKDCENAHKLEALQKRMEKRPENDPQAKALNLTEHKLLYDGVLMLKDGKSKIIECHVVLLEDILVILQKQDEKMVLKPLSSKAMGSLKSDENVKFSSPVIPLVGLLTRNVATDKKAFFLVSISAESRIYELHAYSVDERDKWYRHISEASEAVCKNAPGGILNMPQSQPVVKAQPSVESTKDEMEKEESEGDHEVVPSVSDGNQPETHEEESEDQRSPREVLRRTDKIIENALLEKQRVIAEMMGMPVDEFEHIAEIAGAMEGEKEPRDLIVAAILQMNRLTTLVKETIRPPPAAPSAAGEETTPAANPSSNVSMPVGVLLDIVNHLNQDLTQLLRITREREVEMDSVKRELKTASEQMKLLQDVSLVSPSPGNSRPASYISVCSELSEESDDEVLHDACSTPQPPLFVTPRDSLTSSLDDDGQVTPLVLDGEPQFDMERGDVASDSEEKKKIESLNDAGAVKLDDIGETETEEVFHPGTDEIAGETGSEEVAGGARTHEDEVEPGTEDEEAPTDVTEDADSVSVTHTVLATMEGELIGEHITVSHNVSSEEDADPLATERTENIFEVVAHDTVAKGQPVAKETDANEKSVPPESAVLDSQVSEESVPQVNDVTDNAVASKDMKDDDVAMDSEEEDDIHVVEDHFDLGTDEFELD